jgi:hypothetical protein
VPAERLQPEQIAEQPAGHHEPGGDADANLELADGRRVEPSYRGDASG